MVPVIDAIGGIEAAQSKASNLYLPKALQQLPANKIGTVEKPAFNIGRIPVRQSTRAGLAPDLEAFWVDLQRHGRSRTANLAAEAKIDPLNCPLNVPTNQLSI